MSYAGDLGDKISVSDIALCRTMDGASIKCLEYKLPGNYTIKSYDLDTARHQLLLCVSNQGGRNHTLALFDLNKRIFIWTKDIDHSYGHTFLLGANKIIQTYDFKRTVCYSRHTGQQLWTAKDGTILLDDKNDVAMFRSGSVADLNTGNIKWQGHLQLNYPYSSITYVSNDAVIIELHGLYYINLATGRQWDMPGRTLDETYYYDRNAQGLQAATVEVPVYCKQRQLPTEGSFGQLLVADGRIYFSSADDIMCLDSNGNRIWHKPLPDNASSYSMLALCGRNLLLVNTGYIRSQAGTEIPFGFPYVIAFDKLRGFKYFIDYPATKMFIGSTVINNDTLLLCCDDYLHSYNLKNGTVINREDISKSGLQHCKLYQPEDVYCEAGTDSVMALRQRYGDNSFMQNDKNMIQCLSASFLPADTFSNTGLWRAYLKHDNTLLLQNGNKTLLVKDHKKVTSFEGSYPALSGQNLVDVGKDQFRIIEVGSVL